MCARGRVRTHVMLRTSGEALTGKAAGGHIRRGGHDGHTVVDGHRGGWMQCT